MRILLASPMLEGMPHREMSEADVCSFLDLVGSLGIEIWLDGGWAVDAWLGGQTRAHADVDIVIETRALTTLVDALRARGYDEVPRDDMRPWNFVLGDRDGHEVDFHVIDLAPDGTGIYGPPPPEFIFPADSLTAVTRLCNRVVRAIPPHRLVEFHTGYEPDDDDRADVLALCERFEIEIPSSYRS
jgi:lincosamide nucleotidyltransferase A/C/D/E